jgi:hypothetical protein
MQDAHSPRLTFGKHCGCRVCDIDSGYLAWCLANVSRLKYSLRQAIEAELADRHDRDDEPDRQETSLVTWEPLIRRWFSECTLKHHPDRGGDVESMKIVNDCHDRLRRILVEIT